MLITTTDSIPGKEIIIIGFVEGLCIGGGFKYAQKNAEEDMIKNAIEINADAIIAVKYCAVFKDGLLNVMAYGTAIAYQ